MLLKMLSTYQLILPTAKKRNNKCTIAMDQYIPDCPYYLQGYCRDGSACLLQHDPAINRVCKDYIEGDCKNLQDCQLNHVKGDIVCRHYLREKSGGDGKCRFGDWCWYTHTQWPLSQSPLWEKVHATVYVPISATATMNTANDSSAGANHAEAANSDEVLESGAEGASRESGYETREPSPAWGKSVEFDLCVNEHSNVKKNTRVS